MRKKRVYKKFIKEDLIYNSFLVSKMINRIMKDGKKTIAQKIFYSVMDLIKKEQNTDPLLFFEKSLQNVFPTVELKSKKVGGGNYQVPIEVRKERQSTLAIRWIVEAATKKRTHTTFAIALKNELVDAHNNIGQAIKKKETITKMASSNRVFAHFNVK